MISLVSLIFVAILSHTPISNLFGPWFIHSLCGDRKLEADSSILSPSLTPAVVKSSQHPSKQVWLSWEERSRTVCVAIVDGASQQHLWPQAEAGREPGSKYSSLSPLPPISCQGFPLAKPNRKPEAEEAGGGKASAQGRVEEGRDRMWRAEVADPAWPASHSPLPLPAPPPWLSLSFPLRTKTNSSHFLCRTV